MRDGFRLAGVLTCRYGVILRCLSDDLRPESAETYEYEPDKNPDKVVTARAVIGYFI